jgi:hypothetical protein
MRSGTSPTSKPELQRCPFLSTTATLVTLPSKRSCATPANLCTALGAVVTKLRNNSVFQPPSIPAEAQPAAYHSAVRLDSPPSAVDVPRAEAASAPNWSRGSRYLPAPTCPIHVRYLYGARQGRAHNITQAGKIHLALTVLAQVVAHLL